MEITEVRVSLRDGGNRKLKAYATMTFDNAFVVRNVKVIEGNKGLFVAMPSRKLRESCPKCNFKNPIRSKFCNQCGSSLPVADRRPHVEGDQAQQSEHRDIAHPITLECREYIQKKVIEAYESESKSPASAPHGRPDSKESVPPAAKPEAVKPEVVKPEVVTPEVETTEPVTPDAEEGKNIIEGGDIEL